MLILVCALSMAAIQLANYLMSSIVGTQAIHTQAIRTQAIHGVQGRYFLPLFVLVLLAACGWVSVRRTWLFVASVGAIAPMRFSRSISSLTRTMTDRVEASHLSRASYR